VTLWVSSERSPGAPGEEADVSEPISTVPDALGHPLEAASDGRVLSLWLPCPGGRRVLVVEFGREGAEALGRVIAGFLKEGEKDG
jgi:hypothetical protein